jgi:hypothetical protein
VAPPSLRPCRISGSYIEHALIGPAGVFTIDTKNHRGSNIWVGGNTFTGRLLSQACGFAVAARGVIAVVDPRSLTLRERPVDVEVTTRVQLSRWLVRQPQVLDPNQVDDIFRVARRSSTWNA